jgi:threonine/homoserine/homoserine lactone efflux protein
VFELSEIFTFVVVVVVLLVVPGPAVLLTIARSISGGRKVGVATGAGIAVGDVLHTLMAVLGLSAILMTSAMAFGIVKYMGVAYLVYLGVCAWRERPGSLRMPTAQQVTAAMAFRQAILAEILNPKTALFFLSFLPQFVHPERGAVPLQLLILGMIFVGLSIAVTSSFAVFASVIARSLKRHPSIENWRHRVVGSIYFALGLNLAFQDRR